ncbi:MAG: DNA repair protein RecN [Thermosulfidibacteraceae bacterium]|jgi:DNA repair protein RecN (Recombination protein N)
MISELLIRNFGIIDKVKVQFEEGFNVVTGETGSGKSLILRSIPFLFGFARDNFLLSNEGETVVEAVFTDVLEEVRNLLREQGLDVEDEIVIRRVATQSRSRYYLNDRPVTSTFLKGVFPLLVEVQTQRESIALFNRKKLMDFYDAFCGLLEMRSSYEELYRTYLEKKELLERAEDRVRDIEDKMEILRSFVEEIESMGLLDVDEDSLKKEREALVNAEKLRYALNRILAVVSEEEFSITSGIREILHNLRTVSDYYEPSVSYLEIFERILGDLKEIEISISSDLSRIYYNEEKLNKIEEILWNIEKMKRKYNVDWKFIKEKFKSSKDELVRLEAELDSLKNLSVEFDKLKSELYEFALKLSEERISKKEEFERRIVDYLLLMGFKKPIIEVRFNRLEEPTIYGLDGIDLLFSANPQVPPYPVEKVASGGELSRIMLSLYLTVKRKSGMSLLLDEIDTGIGGYTAKAIGELLRELGATNQIIVVTHFPQIASCANNHIVVEKTLKGDKSYVIVSRVTGEERDKELKRMFGEMKKDLMEGDDGGDR